MAASKVQQVGELKSAISREVRMMRNKFLTLLQCLFCLFLTVLIGGFALRYFESENSFALAEHQYALMKSANLSPQQVTILGEMGISLPTSPKPDVEWTLLQGSFFTMTTLTTIGYGSFAPVTSGGQLFTCFYGLIGMAVVGVTLGQLADVMFQILGAFTSFIKLCFNPKKLDQTGSLTEEETKRIVLTFEEIDTDKSGSVDKSELKEMMRRLNGGVPPSDAEVDAVFRKADGDGSGHITEDEILMAVCSYYQMMMDAPEPPNYAQLLMGLVLFVIILFGGAVLWAHKEGWTYGQAAWFCFISLATIGLGDVVPAATSGSSLFFCMVYNFMGLGVLAYIITAISDIISQKTAQAKSILSGQH